MFSEDRIEGFAKEAVRRLTGRSGRTFQGADKMRRELDAAGRTGRQNHGTTFSYPRGTAVNPAETPESTKEASLDRLATLLNLVGAPRQSGVL